MTIVALPSLTFVPILNTSDADLIADFFVPALANASHYDRGVGFFSAGWLRITANGMVLRKPSLHKLCNDFCGDCKC